jgi:hypothetical protein
MRREIDRRLAALEARSCADAGAWHQVVVEEGVSSAVALRAYGVDKLAAKDHVMLVRIVSPRWGEDGNMIRPPRSEGLRRDHHWQDILAEEAAAA